MDEVIPPITLVSHDERRLQAGSSQMSPKKQNAVPVAQINSVTALKRLNSAAD